MVFIAVQRLAHVRQLVDVYPVLCEHQRDTQQPCTHEAGNGLAGSDSPRQSRLSSTHAHRALRVSGLARWGRSNDLKCKAEHKPSTGISL